MPILCVQHTIVTIHHFFIIATFHKCTIPVLVNNLSVFSANLYWSQFKLTKEYRNTHYLTQKCTIQVHVAALKRLCATARLREIFFLCNGASFGFDLQEHDKQLSLLDQLQRQKLELEQQKREFEEQQQRQKQAELQVCCVTQQSSVTQGLTMLL